MPDKVRHRTHAPVAAPETQPPGAAPAEQAALLETESRAGVNEARPGTLEIEDAGWEPLPTRTLRTELDTIAGGEDADEHEEPKD